MKINLKTPAKINIFLEVENKRSNGYHNLKNIMQTISLYDELFFELTEKNIALECSDKSLSTNSTNIIYKAALAIKNYFNINRGVKIYLKKEIPIGAGLGGGSSDAATTIKTLVNLWNIKTTKSELEQIATSLGADVPFFLTKGTALCEGIGEIITKLKSIGKLNVVLVNPGFKISTIDIYKKIKFPLTNKIKINTIKDFICNESFKTKDAFNSCFNRLEEFVFPDYPEILKIKNVLIELGCVSFMSGSGSTVFGLFDSNSTTQIIKKVKSGLSKYAWRVWFVTTVDCSFNTVS
jgi:4-diphosphocytidyl-2-C-methyl-D-erythritol kinase